ncbi:Rab family GTPase [Desulfococcaceae bacterium HSG7]|nr:Rab family GTPase [Desulfococcaceae bacterium HSG7]
MIQKKICLLGSFAVGKTSLAKRFVHGIYTDKYHTTIGVNIRKKIMQTNDCTVNLVIWDLAGEDEFQKVRLTYLRGASGYLLVADGTRRETLNKAITLKSGTEAVIGEKPFILLLNKVDLDDNWEIDPSLINDFVQKNWLVMATSAKTGQGVEEAFQMLTRKMAEG